MILARAIGHNSTYPDDLIDAKHYAIHFLHDMEDALVELKY